MKRLILIIMMLAWSSFVTATTYHTVSFSGTPSSDFASDEAVSTSSGGVTAYLTWDATNLYLAYAANNGEPVVIYIDTDPQLTPTNGTGTTGGFNYDGITPSLPFTANFVAFLKNGYQEYRTWTGSAWSSNTTTGISTYFGTNTEEYSIPWSTMGGKPTTVYFLMYKDNGGTYVYGQAPAQVSDGTNSSPTFAYFYSDEVTTGISPFGSYDVALSVDMSSYSASYAYNAVTLNWRTQSEISNAGFNIYRKASTDASYSGIASYASDISLCGLGTSATGKSYSFTDRKIAGGTIYDYRIEEVSMSGSIREFGPIRIQASNSIPSAYQLHQNYPNPFNPSTTITVDVKKDGYARLEVFNALGEKVVTLFDGYIQAGTRPFTWDGSKTPSGIYLYRFTVDGFTAVKKMILMK